MVRKIAYIVIALAVLGWFYYAWQVEPNRITTDVHEIRLERLPPELDGLRIALLSDFHMTHYGHIEHEAVAVANGLHPDMIILDGDYVGGRFIAETPRSDAECSRMLRDFHAPLGVWAGLGNYELPEFAQLAKDAGVIPLTNRSRYIRAKGSGFWLVGANCPAGIVDLSLSCVGLPRDGFKLLFTHNPERLSAAPYLASKIDLALCGHTHGGQVRFLGLGSLYLSFKSHFPERGEFRIGDMKIYITQGVGENCVPLRFDCPPQVSLIVLRADHRGSHARVSFRRSGATEESASECGLSLASITTRRTP